MNHPSKLTPIQGMTLLFLLLIIPVGIYLSQSQNVIGDIRSRAEEVFSTKKPQVLKAKPCATLVCPEGQISVPLASVVSAMGAQQAQSGNQISNQEKKMCVCQSSTVGTLANSKGGVSAKSTSTPTPTSTLAQTMSQRCNTGCTSDASCGEGMICVKDVVVGADGKETEVGKCRNAQCYGIDDCWCYKLTSPTPTPGSKCDDSCTTDADCGTSFICVQTAVKTAQNPNPYQCRNPQCFGIGREGNCLCYSTILTPTPTVADLPGTYATPTPVTGLTDYNPGNLSGLVPNKPSSPFLQTTPAGSSDILLADLLTPTPNPLFPSLKTGVPILTIFPFYNAKKQTNPTFLLTGTSDPDADLSLTIFPDGVTAMVKADALGNWQYPVLKKLTNGEKQLTAVARSQSGGQMTKTEAFMVVGAFQFPVAAIVFGVLLVAGIGGYVWYMNKKHTKPGNPPAGPYMPVPPQDVSSPYHASSHPYSSPPAPDQPTHS